MKAALIIILLVSICLLHAGVDLTDIPVYPDFDAQRLAGIWYPTAAVFRNHKPIDRISIEDVVEPSEEGDLVLTMRYIEGGKCKVAKVHVVHTEEPGVFNVLETSETVHMVDVDYDSYHIVHVQLNKSRSLYLLSRTRRASDEVKTKFRTIAKTLGFNVKRMISTRLAVSCP